MILNDQPIKTSQEDVLERNSFSKHLASAIYNYQNDESLVISINGEWGSGKSSAINLMVEELKNLNYKNNKIPQIIYFNPWNFSNQNQLYEQFFTIIAYELGQSDNSTIRTIGRAIKKYSKILEAGKYFPPLTILTEIFRIIFEHLGELLSNIGIDFKSNLEKTKELINKLLLNVDKKILIVIDDIDRLTKTEISQIFQMVKSLGDFKNTIYILSFDKNVVASSLEEVQTGSGVNYLEKIIQIPFEIPDAPTHLLHKYFNQSLTNIIKKYPDDKFDRNYWTIIFNYGVKFLIKNIRDVNRFCNVFHFKYNILKNEVNIIDLISLTCIEIFEPELFLDIKNNKDLFTGTFEKSTFAVRTEWAKGDNLEKIKQLEEIINKVKRTKKIHIKKLLEKMFPKFDESNHSGGSLRDWRKNGRIASVDNFDTFFVLDFSEEKISNSKMNQIIGSTKDLTDFGENIKEIIEQDLTNDFLDKFLDHSFYLKNQHIAQNVINVLMNLGDLFPEKEFPRMFETPADTFIRILINTIIENFDKQEERYNLYKNSIEYAQKSLYTPLYQIWQEDYKHGKYTTDKPDSEEKLHTSLKQLEKLEKLCVTKIYEWKNNGDLINHPKLSFILYVWKCWENEEAVQKFIQENIRTDIQFINFIEKFLSYSTIYSDTVSKSPKMDNKTLDEFLDKSQTEIRIRKILDEKIELTPSQKIALEKYIENIKPKQR